MRGALGADAAPLEAWVRLHLGAVQRGHADARVFVDRLIGCGAGLTGTTDKETVEKENAEIRRHGGTPVPVRPAWDPRKSDEADRFLAACFLSARSRGSAAFERAVVFARAKRCDETIAGSTHIMERVWVWANGSVAEARAFHRSQPGQERLVNGPAAADGQWIGVLAREFRNATGKDLFDGGKGMVD